MPQRRADARVPRGLTPPDFDSLRIGAYDYAVRWLGGWLADGQGEQNSNSHEISIGLVGSPANVANTLLHEVLHAVFDTTALGASEGMTKDKEEFIVRALTEGLLQVVRDNPQFTLALVGLLGRRA